MRLIQSDLSQPFLICTCIPSSSRQDISPDINIITLFLSSEHELGTFSARKDTFVSIRARFGHFLCSGGHISYTCARFGVFSCPKSLSWCNPRTFWALFVLRRSHFLHSCTFGGIFVPETKRGMFSQEPGWKSIASEPG